MTVAEIVRAEIAKFLKTGEAAPAPTPKKAVSDELREKRLKALEKAREAKKAKKASPAGTVEKAKPAAKPARKGSIDPVAGKRVRAEAYVSAKGTKSILIGNGDKQGKLVFHSQNELREFINDLHGAIGGDVDALAGLHFGG